MSANDHVSIRGEIHVTYADSISRHWIFDTKDLLKYRAMLAEIELLISIHKGEKLPERAGRLRQPTKQRGGV